MRVSRSVVHVSDPWVISPDIPPLAKQGFSSCPLNQELLRSNVSLLEVCMAISDTHSIDGPVTVDEDVVFTAWSPDGVGHDSIERPVDLCRDGSSDHAIVDFSFESVLRVSAADKTCCLHVVLCVCVGGCVQDLPAWSLQAPKERILRIHILRIVVIQLVESFLDTRVGLGHLDFVANSWAQEMKAGFCILL